MFVLFIKASGSALTPALFGVDLLTLPFGKNQNCILKRLLWITSCASGPQFGPAVIGDLDTDQTKTLVQFIQKIICGWSILLGQLQKIGKLVEN